MIERDEETCTAETLELTQPEKTFSCEEAKRAVAKMEVYVLRSKKKLDQARKRAKLVCARIPEKPDPKSASPSKKIKIHALIQAERPLPCKEAEKIARMVEKKLEYEERILE